MTAKTTLFLLIFVVVLVELPSSFSFRFTSSPPKPLAVYYYTNKTNVKLRWDWNLENDVLNSIRIERYRTDNVAGTETQLIKFYSGGNKNEETPLYRLIVEERASGYAEFFIKNILNQGINEGKDEASGEKTPVDVMKENTVYVYTIEVDIKSISKPKTDSVKLAMFKTPTITTYPKNQTASGGTVTFECAADGKPKPTITWEKIGSSQYFTPNSPLTISDFDVSKIGVYRCTAKSAGIAKNATGIGYVQFPTCGSGCTKEELGIEFTDLIYNNEYESSSYNKYRDLKNKIETQCLIDYANSGKTIHKCEVKRFRGGSVVAVVELGWPTNTVGPKQPLLQAIRDGNFAGYKVKTDFVSPTSPPTEKPPSTKSSTPATTSSGGPDSGARSSESGGLSTGAIIALVVVFSIIFIVIIVVLIVCMLKRKKPSDSRKPYKEDGRTYDKPTTTVPLKSQPFDPMYDDPNEDRYPNGGGPPPQYTPSSNYAEVKPSQQDESQVEWDKSVKDEMWI